MNPSGLKGNQGEVWSLGPNVILIHVLPYHPSRSRIIFGSVLDPQ